VKLIKRRKWSKRERKFWKKKQTPLAEMSENLVKAKLTVPARNPRAGMDAMLADMAKVDDSKKYALKVKTKTKQYRVIVEAIKTGCEECSDRYAAIFSDTFKKNLCLECEERLLVDAGAVVFDRWKKRKKGDR